MATRKKRLLLLDANSMVHRAYHALPPLTTSKGEMVNAVYGFISVLLKTIKEFSPDYIAAAFDMMGPTFRHEKFAEYKATRAQAPDELYQQFPLVREALSVLRIPVYEKEGFEADDIIGTIALKASQDSFETVIVSSDLDILQLVGKKTKVYNTRDSMLYDEKSVIEKFQGLKPKQLIDYKGLRGDPSDNIPGVPGVGEKTAIQLLQQFRSVEGIYQALEKQRDVSSLKVSVREKLQGGREKAFQSKDLATIDTSVPLAFRLEDAAWKEPAGADVQKMLSRFEFESLGKRMPGIQQKMFGEKGRKEDQKEQIQERVERLYRDGVLSMEVYKLEKRLTPILREMEETGIKIDSSYFERLAGEMEESTASLRKKIYKYSRGEFNINSTQQLSRVLFEDLAISPRGMKKTPKGVISIASPELEKLVGVHPVVREVLKYREIQKLLTTYAKPLPSLADDNGRIHTHFDQLGAATGRLSSSEPNLQNIPNQGEWGKRIRQGFIAEAGFQLVSFDYSQVELRIAAHISRDPQMRRFFEENADFHRMTAAAVFGVGAEEVTPDMRFRAKALNFGILYGMGAQGFAKSAGISTEEAREFIDQYFLRFPKLYEYMEETKQQARQQGYVETMMGRRRYIPEINSATPQLRAAAERMAINHPIQGSAADMIKVAMVQVHTNVQQFQGTANMLVQIHDELLFEVADDIIQEVTPVVRRAMEEASTLQVPIKVDVRAGKSWGDGVSFSL